MEPIEQEQILTKSIEQKPPLSKKELEKQLKDKVKEDPALAFMQMETQSNPSTIMMCDAEAQTWSKCDIPGFRRAVGIGVPHGTLILIHGPAAGGKTALLAIIISSFQKDNFPTGFYDVECAADIIKAGTKELKVKIEEIAIKKWGWFKDLGIDV